MISVIVNGANGKMGQETVRAVKQDPHLKLVAQLGRQDNLREVIAQTQAQIVIDFTNPQSVYENVITMIESNVHPVIGTTGLTSDQITELQKRASEKHLGGIIAPNFSIAAVLMMRYAQDIARYFPSVEIIELHHNGKKDAPSGTALKTALMIKESGANINSEIPDEHESISGARGANSHGIHIHSIRLPGLVAHQQVIFGSKGETLTLKHDCIHREAFMPGVILACKKVMQLDHLAYGLDQIL